MTGYRLICRHPSVRRGHVWNYLTAVLPQKTRTLDQTFFSLVQDDDHTRTRRPEIVKGLTHINDNTRDVLFSPTTNAQGLTEKINSHCPSGVTRPWRIKVVVL